MAKMAKMAKMAMLVIAFEDLKKPVETSYSGYCASHPPLALPENLESRRGDIGKYGF